MALVPTSAPSHRYMSEGSGDNDECDGHCVLIVVLGILLILILVAGSMMIHCYFSSSRRRLNSSSGGVGLLGTPLLDDDEEKQYLADNEGKPPYAAATTEAFFDALNAKPTPARATNLESADLVAPPFDDDDGKLEDLNTSLPLEEEL